MPHCMISEAVGAIIRKGLHFTLLAMNNRALKVRENEATYIIEVSETLQSLAKGYNGKLK